MVLLPPLILQEPLVPQTIVVLLAKTWFRVPFGSPLIFLATVAIPETRLGEWSTTSVSNPGLLSMLIMGPQNCEMVWLLLDLIAPKGSLLDLPLARLVDVRLFVRARRNSNRRTRINSKRRTRRNSIRRTPWNSLIRVRKGVNNGVRENTCSACTTNRGLSFVKWRREPVPQKSA